MNNARTKTLGNAGEALVENYLQDLGYKILEKNYRRRYGEIDLIAAKGDLIAFVEVKARNNPAFSAMASITRSKQHKIFLAAKSFIAKQRITDKILRFDVALVTVFEGNTTIEYIENAFVPEN